MSLITRCPACGTMFKVVPDQLKISEGWVRCGHCAEVFDASAQMQPLAPAAGTPAAAVAPEAPPVGSETDAPFFSEQDIPVNAPAGVPEPDAGPVQTSLPSSQGHEEVSDDSQIESIESANLDEVSFVRQARRKAFWVRPKVRATLTLLALVLLAALALQVTVQQRDRIATVEPRAAPLLDALCARLHCAIAPLRQIESVLIDSSSFNKLRADVYRLGFVVKNSAPYALATPAIELTLTDAQDQPVLRRVLAVRDIGGNGPAILGAGAEWAGSVSLAVIAPGTRIAGYRILAFYP